MKHYLFAFLLLSFIACKKGDDGPQGPQGPQGNASVTMYTFESQSFVGLLRLYLKDISPGRIDSSLILVYYNPYPEATTAWYPSPGIGSGAGPGPIYQTRFYLYQSSASPSIYELRLFTSDLKGFVYPNPVTFRKIRVIIAPAANIIPGARQSSSPPVNYADYYAVLRYYHLSE